MFSLGPFSLLGGTPSAVPFSSAMEICPQQTTTSNPQHQLDASTIQIQDLTMALRAINNHPFKKYTIGQVQSGRFPVTRLGALSRETVQQSVEYVMGYFGNANSNGNEVGSAHMALRPSDNSEYLCRELFIALYNGLSTLSDIYQYDAICHWRLIQQVAQSILPQVLPSDFILQENELICHVIAEFIGAHVFLRCATLTVPIERSARSPQPTNNGPPPLLFRGPTTGRSGDLMTDWNENIDYASSGLESEEELMTTDVRSRSGAMGALHAVSPPPAPSGGFGYVSPQPLHLIRSARVRRRSVDEARADSLAHLAESAVSPHDNCIGERRMSFQRTASRSFLSSQSTSPQPSLQRSSSSAGHNFASTSFHEFDEKDNGDAGGDSSAGNRGGRPKQTRRHHTFVLADSHGSVLRDDIFVRNWEEFDVMFWRGVRMCDVSLLVDQNLSLYTRMPHRRMWFMPTSPFAPRSHLSTPYAPLYQYYVKKWHFSPVSPPNVRSPSNGPRTEIVTPKTAQPKRVSQVYSLCPDSQGVASALSYTLPIATQTTHEYLFGNESIQESDCRLFCAIDEPSAVFDVQGTGSGDSSFSCSGSDDFHTALVIEELRAIHPSQVSNDDEMSDADREYLYFEDQIDCDHVRVARCCEWAFECGGGSGRMCDNVFVACCYDSSQPFLIFSSSFSSVRRAKNHMNDCRRLLIPSLNDERRSFLMTNTQVSRTPPPPPPSCNRRMRACKVKFETLSSTANPSGTCSVNRGTLIAGVQYVNPQPNVEPNSCTSPVFVPGSTRIVVYKFDTSFNLIGSHTVGEGDGSIGRCDLSHDVGIVFVLEDMVVTHEFIYLLLSTEPNPHFLGRRLSSNPWMRLPHHDDTASASSDEQRSESGDGDHVSDEDEEDDCPRFRNVDNRWRVVLRTDDMSFVCMEPDRVQFPGATLGCVVPMEMFDI